VRAAPKWEMAADWWVSPWGRGGGGTATVAVKNAPVTVVILAFVADGPSPGWTGKAAMCLSVGAKKRSGEDSGTAADIFERARAWSGEGRRGVDSVPREGRRGAKREGPGCGTA
jgi:hypothetical protein